MSLVSNAVIKARQKLKSSSGNGYVSPESPHIRFDHSDVFADHFSWGEFFFGSGVLGSKVEPWYYHFSLEFLHGSCHNGHERRQSHVRSFVVILTIFILSS